MLQRSESEAKRRAAIAEAVKDQPRDEKGRVAARPEPDRLSRDKRSGSTAAHTHVSLASRADVSPATAA